ncbi:MAG: TadE/TadG family type IV pilus assembly protein [Pseudomonadota bacterium]
MGRTIVLVLWMRRFAEARRGSAAVEFALIAGPFFALMMAILEVGLVFFTSSVMEDSMLQAAREIRTGEFQTGGNGRADFLDTVCESFGNIGDCSKLSVDVRTFDNFTSVTVPDPVVDDEFSDAGFVFEPGGAGDVVLVRVFYRKKLFTPSLGVGLANIADNEVLMSAATAFRSEPFAQDGGE